MLLMWDKPKKLRSSEEHAEKYSSDCGVPGTYVPNMSYDDRLKWKAKKIGGEDPRIEIRKTVTGKERESDRWGNHAQVLIIVRPNKSVTVSANGRMVFDDQTWKELHQAVGEASLCFSKIVKS